MSKQTQQLFVVLAWMCYLAGSLSLVGFLVTDERWQALFLSVMALAGSLILIIVAMFRVDED